MPECNGDCCQRFWLALSPEEIWEQYENWIKNEGKISEDIDLIGPMVIYLEPDTPSGYWYTCKHWDRDTRLCKIYESRPRMCRNYPYSKPCTYCGWVNEEFIEQELAEAKEIGEDYIRSKIDDID